MFKVFSPGNDFSWMKRFDLIARGTTEIITEPELREVLKRKWPAVYCGYEPSGKIHFGHALTIWKLADFQKAGAKVKVLLADLHAYLNDKGPLEEIRRVADYNRHCFIALGLDPGRTEFLLGSGFQLKPEFMMDVLRMATETTLLRARRSMAEIARHLKDPDVAQALYPLMQAVDMAHLSVDVAVGGLDQRKVHMVAREKLPALGYRKPVCIHVPILHGLDGDAKMSSSKGNFIAIDESESSIKEKIRGTYCPPKVLKDNPIAEYVEHVVWPVLGELKIPRAAKYGGPIEITTTTEFKKLYVTGKLHPADLKSGVADALVEVFEPVRRYFEEHPDARLTRHSPVL